MAVEVLGRQPDLLPDSLRYGIETGRITVTRAKTPEEIATDIRRRLLPELDQAARRSAPGRWPTPPPSPWSKRPSGCWRACPASPATR
ncbi:hypothetical protein ACFQZC_38640 [Streptacidiphilus monticola]